MAKSGIADGDLAACGRVCRPKCRGRSCIASRIKAGSVARGRPKAQVEKRGRASSFLPPVCDAPTSKCRRIALSRFGAQQSGGNAAPEPCDNCSGMVVDKGLRVVGGSQSDVHKLLGRQLLAFDKVERGV